MVGRRWSVFNYSPGNVLLRHETGFCYLPLSWVLCLISWGIVVYAFSALFDYIEVIPYVQPLAEVIENGDGVSYATANFCLLEALFAFLPSFPSSITLTFPNYFHAHHGYEQYLLWASVFGLFAANTLDSVHYIWELSMGNEYHFSADVWIP